MSDSAEKSNKASPSNDRNKPTSPNYVLEVHTVQVQGFKGTLEAIKDLLNDCNIHFDKNGMKIKSIDGKHVALVHIRYEEENFDRYYCERDLSIGINIATVLKILKNVGQNDTLQLFVNRGDYDKAVIRIQNAEKGAIHEHKLKLMDIDDDDIDIPETTFTSIITMPSGELHALCKQYKEFSKFIDIKSVGNQVIFSYNGDETEGKSILQNNENGLIVQKGDEDEGEEEIIQAKFLLHYLVIFSKAYNLSNTVEILLKNDYPMVLKYSIADLGTLKFCLAPMSEDE
jgi:proliferating cell nuclear antigen